jgi:hypothetical protein
VYRSQEPRQRTKPKRSNGSEEVKRFITKRSNIPIINLNPQLEQDGLRKILRQIDAVGNSFGRPSRRNEIKRRETPRKLNGNG